LPGNTNFIGTFGVELLKAFESFLNFFSEMAIVFVIELSVLQFEL
jgi:hypothetical protein